MYAAERRMHSGGRKLHQLMVIADCPLRSLANGGLYVRDEAEAAVKRAIFVRLQTLWINNFPRFWSCDSKLFFYE